MLQFPKDITVKLFSTQETKINVLCTALLHIPLSTYQKNYVFHRQVLKSSLFSARIEGNTLTLENIEQENLKTSTQKNKREISNVLRALSIIKSIESINTEKILNIHRIIMDELNAAAGLFRKEISAIFDQSGAAVYVTPDLNEVTQMLDLYINHINASTNTSSETIVRAAQCHYYFEKIHPFIDGNGRTGRVLMHWQLLRNRFLDDFILPIDEFFDINRSEYYRLLEKNTKNMADFAAFFFEGVIWSLEKTLEDIKNIPEETRSTTNLLPRRQEILNIITDHPHCSLDLIARRFPTIPRRTIAYDVQTLLKLKLVIKHGTTRGAVYSAI